MNLGGLRRILKSDLGKNDDVPSWVVQLLISLNQSFDKLFLALTGNLTFRDNFSCRVTTVEFKSAVEKEISPQSNLKVTGVLPLDTGGILITGFGTTRKTNGNIGVTFTFTNLDGTAAESAEIQIAILF